MSQMISFLGTSSVSCSTTRAVAPVVHQDSLTIAVGAGASYQDLLAALASGACAADAGQIVNTGCYDLQVKATYLDGADCDNCTVDTLATVDVTVIIPANSAFPMPPGYVKQIQVRTVNSSEAAVSNTTEQKARYYGAYAPGCNGCPLVA